jgi:hypothetical protein
MFKKKRIRDVHQDAMGVITILIYEIQTIITRYRDKYMSKDACLNELDDLIDSWIKANDLHPEHVKTFSSHIIEEIIND